MPTTPTPVEGHDPALALPAHESPEACERLKQAVAATTATSRLADLLRASQN